MKVTHVITGLGRGGAEGALFRLCEASGHDQVSVISLTDGGLYGPRLATLGISVDAVEMRSALFVLPAFFRLRRILKRLKPDIVQTWMYHADLLGGLAAVSMRVPVCWGIRHSDLSPVGNKRLTLWVVHLCAWLSRLIPKRVIACSNRAAEMHLARGYKAAFDVVYNGFDVTKWTFTEESREQVRKALGIPLEAFVFAHAGRADPQKDHANLARAFSFLVSKGRDVRLLLCGAGLEPGNEYFESLPFTDDARKVVIALGARDDLPRLWRAGDSFVLASSFGEAFPNVVAEAMASGMPCVVTDVGDAADIVGSTGYVVPPSDPAALSSAMASLRDMTVAERLDLGAEAKRRIENCFTLGRMVGGFRKVWSEVIEQRRSSCAG